VGFSTGFGTFVLDTGRHQLLEAGREVHLSPKAYEFLRLLLSERPRALAKTELHERLWPGTFVTDATLASLVAEVRHALRDGSGDGRFIRTVHAYGYAFEGAATNLEESAPPEPPPAWLDGEHGRFALRPGENLLGRESHAIAAFEETIVSRHHARIMIGPGAVTIEDLGSKNGTWVRGVRVTTPVPLEDGDEIRLGSITLFFRTLQDPGSTETMREEALVPPRRGEGPGRRRQE
jgi:DNA-binding winged helix-turn-helix (wHTH) protein